MGRINTNVASLNAQRGLAKTQLQLNDTMRRLSSGLAINRGADNPAGLIASEGLRSEMAGIDQAIDNSQRASNVIATAEGALSEVASLLLNVKSLIVEAANSGALSPDEISANQLQVDSAVDSITRISNTTSFAGLKLLDGSLDYLTSGVDMTNVRALQIDQANFGTAESLPVAIDVIASARKAELFFTGSAVSNSLTLQVTGSEGVDVLTFVSGTTASGIAFAVNQLKDHTGIEAFTTNSATSSGITFRSAGYGTREFVSIQALSGAFNTVDGASTTRNRTEGQDAVATINGALTVGDGLDIQLNTTALDLQLTLDESFGIGETDFAITGGGALFQLGPKVRANQQVNIGLQSIAASRLGNSNIGYLSDLVTGGNSSLNAGETQGASDIIEESIRQVSILRGKLGAFERNTLDTNRNSLSVALENVTASESTIRDADFAKETAALTRAQILTQAGTSVLATANQQPQAVLSLLGG